MKDTVSRKNCVITVKNDDTICLARALVTALEIVKGRFCAKRHFWDTFGTLLGHMHFTRSTIIKAIMLLLLDLN